MNVEQIEQNNQQGRFASLKTWAKLLPFLKPYSRNMAVILSLMLVSAGCDLAYPLLSGYAVDHFVTPGRARGWAGTPWATWPWCWPRCSAP